MAWLNQQKRLNKKTGKKEPYWAIRRGSICVHRLLQPLHQTADAGYPSCGFKSIYDGLAGPPRPGIIQSELSESLLLYTQGPLPANTQLAANMP